MVRKEYIAPEIIIEPLDYEGDCCIASVGAPHQGEGEGSEEDRRHHAKEFVFEIHDDEYQEVAEMFTVEW